MRLSEFMARFAEVETTADGYLVHCPAHSDSQASLRITVGTKGGVQRVLVKCRANCDTPRVMEALGLTMRDLAGMEVDKVEFDKLATSQDKLASPGDRARLATELDGYAKALTAEAIVYAQTRFGVSTTDAERLGLGFTTALDGHPRLVIPFRDRDEGTLGFQARAMDDAATRWSGPPSPDGASWAKAGFFPGTAQFDEVIITEGPGDALTVACALGYNAIGIRGAGMTKPAVVDEVVALLDGAEAVVAGDGDDAGRKFAADLAKQLSRRGVTVRVLSLPDGMDLSDLRAADPEGFYAEVQHSISAAKPVTDALSDWDEDTYTLTDLGGARFLRDYIVSLGSGVKYTPETGFLLLDHGVWRRDETQLIRTRAQAVADIVQRLAVETRKEAARDGASEFVKGRAKRFTEYARQAQSTRGIDAMIRELQAVEGVPARITDFDRHHHLLAVRNGVIDLRSGELKPEVDPNLMLTRRVNVDYVPDAASPLWESYLAKSFEKHPEMIPFLRRAVGYGVTGYTGEHCFLIHWGHGANGKSVFLDTLARVFNEYTTVTPFSTFEQKSSSGIPSDIAALKGARLVMASEGEHNKPMAEAILKAATGGDQLTARHLHKDYFTFTPTFLLQLATNHKPKFKGQDDGLWRRVKLIPWDTYIPPEERDGGLCDKLVNHHAEAVLAWAVRGAQEWYLDGLQDPDSVKAATADYKETSNQLSGFLPGVLVEDPSAPLLPGPVIYDAYLNWADDEGLQNRERWTRATLYAALEEKASRHSEKGGKKVWFSGLRFADVADSPIKSVETTAPAPQAPAAVPAKPRPARGMSAKSIIEEGSEK